MKSVKEIMDGMGLAPKRRRNVALSDERLKAIAEEREFAEAWERKEMARELLAIRERQASAYAGAAPDAFTDAMERAVLGLPPPAPQRLYSEAEVRKAVITGLEDERSVPHSHNERTAGFILRRLRVEGEVKAEPLVDCELHDLGLPGRCTCAAVTS